MRIVDEKSMITKAVWHDTLLNRVLIRLVSSFLYKERLKISDELKL